MTILNIIYEHVLTPPLVIETSKYHASWFIESRKGCPPRFNLFEKSCRYR